MPEVQVAALGAVRKMVGFSQRPVNFAGGSVADLLRAIATEDGGTLYSHLVCDGRLRGDYAVLINGAGLRSDQLDAPLAGGEHVVTMAILRHLHGG